MKIVHITSSYPRYPEDGTAPFIRSFVDEQLGLGYDVFVLAPYDPAVKEDYQEKFVTRFRYIRPNSLHIMGHAKALRADVQLRPLAYVLIPLYLLIGTVQLFRISLQEKPDILHAHWVLPNGPIAALVSSLLNIPLVISLHGSDIYIANKNKLFQTIARMTFGAASCITSCSEDLRNRAKNTGTEKNIVVTPWGVNPKIFKYDEARKQRLRSDDGIEAVRTIMSLGRMTYKKGFHHLVEAMPAVLARFPNTRFVIGGDGPVREELRQSAESLGVSNSLELPGKIPWDKVPEFLNNGDIFVLPSVQDTYGNVDGLPTVMLEAMSTGLPVIASEIGGIDMVIDINDNGIMVPPGDTAALQTSILRLLESPEEAIRMGRRAREEIESQFTWKHVAYFFDSLYQEAL